jgi:hypothetical protein
MEEPIAIGETDFVPFRNSVGEVSPPLRDLGASLDTILSGYVDTNERSISNCVVVTMKGRTPAWALEDSGYHIVQRNTSLLLLSAFSQNDYFTGIGCYANSTMFQLYWQRFAEPVRSLALKIKRRDGSTTIGGYQHGEIKFSVPLQVTSFDNLCLDREFCACLDRGISANSQVIRDLSIALSFFALANTDNEVMLPEAEIILMGSAFEQLFHTDGAYKLCRKFGALFNPYGTVTVERLSQIVRTLKLIRTMKQSRSSGSCTENGSKSYTTCEATTSTASR